MSQAFWHEQKKGNTVETPWGDCVLLDMRHLGEKKINERLPLVRELASSYVGHDPVTDPVPVRPVIHFMMGGIDSNINGETPDARPVRYWRDGLFGPARSQSTGLQLADRLAGVGVNDRLSVRLNTRKKRVAVAKILPSRPRLTAS